MEKSSSETDLQNITPGKVVLEGKLEIQKKGRTCLASISGSKVSISFFSCLMRFQIWWNDTKGRLVRELEWSSVAGTQMMEKESKLILHACPWKKKNSKRRIRKDYVMFFKKKEELAKWHETIRMMIKRSEYKGLERTKRRKIIVFINPYSGTKMGPKMWKEIHPLFQAAQIDTVVIGMKC